MYRKLAGEKGTEIVGGKIKAIGSWRHGALTSGHVLHESVLPFKRKPNNLFFFK